MNIRLLLCFISVFIWKTEISSQILEPPTYIQKAKIGLVDEFIKRFNGQEYHPDVSLSKFSHRRDNLLYLFNASKSIEKKDSVLNEIVSFIDVILQDSTPLKYSDQNWFGVATCKGVLFGKTVTFDLYLSVQRRGDDMYKWVIAKADGRCFDIDPKNKSEKIMLSPDSHETKFISLRRMTLEQPFNVYLFMTNEFCYDQTSAFAYLVKTGQLKIDHVDNLEFVFTQVPGYLFYIKYFERDSGNSGWLINKFYKISDSDKRKLLNSLHIENNIEVGFTSKRYVTNGDSIEVNFTQELINKRAAEKSQIACDYIKYIQTAATNTTTRKYYINRLKKLFVKDAVVHINDVNQSLNAKTIAIDAFCDKYLSKPTKIVYKVDSISVPSMDELRQGIESSLIKGEQTTISVEQTEDGKEVSIYLGDLFISKEE